MTIRHYSRRELLALAHGDGSVSRDHLETCPECRQLCRLLADFPVAGRPHLPDPPSSWINRAAAIARIRRESFISRLLASLTYDSWSQPQPVGVRGTATSDHRQVRFEADGIGVELRAERLATGWAFSARIDDASPSAVLRCGQKECYPDRNGFYEWTAARPPQSIRIECDDRIIELPRLSWTRKRPRP